MATGTALREPLNTSEAGFALIGLVVAIFLILLALSVAAPTVARALRRDRELETVQRAKQYDRAIQLFYKKSGTYPGSLDQLEKSNNIRYLRQRYPDPMTGKPDWRLIKVGENKTTVKGFFGKPLGGIASTGLGSASGMASAGGTGTPIGSSTSGFGQGSGFGASTTPTTNASSTGGSGLPGTPATGTNPTSGTSSGTGFGQSSIGAAGSGAPFLGVGLPGGGSAILVVNEQTTYPEWEFLYDPRIEQLKAKVNLLGGGMSSTSATGLGTASSLTSGMPTAPTNGAPLTSSPTPAPGANSSSPTPSNGP